MRGRRGWGWGVGLVLSVGPGREAWAGQLVGRSLAGGWKLDVFWILSIEGFRGVWREAGGWEGSSVVPWGGAAAGLCGGGGRVCVWGVLASAFGPAPAPIVPPANAAACSARPRRQRHLTCLPGVTAPYRSSEFEGILEKTPAEANAFLADPEKYIASECDTVPPHCTAASAARHARPGLVPAWLVVGGWCSILRLFPHRGGVAAGPRASASAAAAAAPAPAPAAAASLSAARALRGGSRFSGNGGQTTAGLRPTPLLLLCPCHPFTAPPSVALPRACARVLELPTPPHPPTHPPPHTKQNAGDTLLGGCGEPSSLP